ncbi:hypothetical protein K443DRAFT_103338 [Laccaria amethystina LaAM-08-1]|uniref:Uncharacterized protein n=1 Tax=Laccaria amethystina LaAM-08-1 TaxID=1095629 RepID=A0A0C9X0Z2_9AGAR|nr:hypothetical protein K443DRAFT_103338 [Laccaria amethystina LaAM-08-1]
MCIRTRIKHVYQGVQGACPRQAVTRARGMAEHRAVGTGLKLLVVKATSYLRQTFRFILGRTVESQFRPISRIYAYLKSTLPFLKFFVL